MGRSGQDARDLKCSAANCTTYSMLLATRITSVHKIGVHVCPKCGTLVDTENKRKIPHKTSSSAGTGISGLSDRWMYPQSHLPFGGANDCS